MHGRMAHTGSCLHTCLGHSTCWASVYPAGSCVCCQQPCSGTWAPTTILLGLSFMCRCPLRAPGPRCSRGQTCCPPGTLPPPPHLMRAPVPCWNSEGCRGAGGSAASSGAGTPPRRHAPPPLARPAKPAPAALLAGSQLLQRVHGLRSGPRAAQGPSDSAPPPQTSPRAAPGPTHPEARMGTALNQPPIPNPSTPPASPALGKEP